MRRALPLMRQTKAWWETSRQLMMPLKAGGQWGERQVLGSDLLMPVPRPSNQSQRELSYCSHSSLRHKPTLWARLTHQVLTRTPVMRKDS